MTMRDYTRYGRRHGSPRHEGYEAAAIGEAMGQEQAIAANTRQPVVRSGRGSAAPPRARFGTFVRHHWGALLVLALYAAAFVVPTLPPAAIGDDWDYVRSVGIPVRQGELKIIDICSADKHLHCRAGFWHPARCACALI